MHMHTNFDSSAAPCAETSIICYMCMTCVAVVACSGVLSSRTRTSRGKRMEMPCSTSAAQCIDAP